MTLTRDAILKADDLQRKEVPVPEWGGTVCVRVLTGIERDRFEAKVRDAKITSIRAPFAALVLCDQAGERLFSDADVTELEKKSSAALSRVLEVGMALNAITDDDVEELEKN